MKSTLFLSTLAAGCLTAVAQTAPPPATPVRAERIDPIRFRQYDVNQDGKLDLQEQEAERESRAALSTKRPAPPPATPGNPAMEARRKEHMRQYFTEQILKSRTNQSASASRQLTPQEQQRLETILKQMENMDRTRRAEYEAAHAPRPPGAIPK